MKTNPSKLVTTTKPQFRGVSVRTTDDDTEARLDRVAEEMSKRASGLQVKRGSVAKTAMLRGLEVLERELGIAK